MKKVCFLFTLLIFSCSSFEMLTLPSGEKISQRNLRKSLDKVFNESLDFDPSEIPMDSLNRN